MSGSKNKIKKMIVLKYLKKNLKRKPPTEGKG